MSALTAVTGTARLGKRTKDLTKRLQPGDIAIIDHEDIDRVAAEALVERAPGAVLNVSASTSGRYPNAGPRILIDAGIVLVDDLGESVFEGIRDGQTITVLDGEVLIEDVPIAHGTRQDDQSVTASLEVRPGGAVRAGSKLFAQNTMEYMLRERDLLLDGNRIPAGAHPHGRASGAHRGAGLPLQRGPGDPQTSPPREPTDHHRRRRRRRRGDRGGLPRGHDHR